MPTDTRYSTAPLTGSTGWADQSVLILRRILLARTDAPVEATVGNVVEEPSPETRSEEVLTDGTGVDIWLAIGRRQCNLAESFGKAEAAKGIDGD